MKTDTMRRGENESAKEDVLLQQSTKQDDDEREGRKKAERK
jgi:hypothetical protein